MKHTVKRFAFCMALTMLCSVSPVSAANTAKATIPGYTWELEYQNIDYKNSIYPPLNYKGVTYFPMTWDYCRVLGLTSVWIEGEGLFIASWGSYGFATGEYGANVFPTYEATYNPKTVTATLPTYPIWVNGKQIDNSKEEYPLLNFRGVTYFPMTWRFAREEFNWNTEWSEKDNRFAVHWPIDSDWSFRINAYEVTDKEAYLVKDISQVVPTGETTEQGDMLYTVRNSRAFFTLDLAAGTLAESTRQPSYDSWADGKTNYLPVGRLPEGVTFRTERHYTDDSIPAPYTPFIARGYVTVDGTDYFIGEGISITDAVRTPDFVFCNARRYTGWKGWTNPNAELYRIDCASGRVERIDTQDIYNDYGSMNLLGYCSSNGQIYLKCQQGSKVYSGEGGVMEASAYNDGYYTMNPHTGALKLLRRFVYTDNDILTPDGRVYGVFNWKNTVERLV